MNGTAPTTPTTTDPAQLAATIDMLLAQRMAAMTQPQPQPQPVAQAMALPPGFMPAGFQPMQQQPAPAFNGYGMQPAASTAPPMPTELLARISIPLPDGREVGGYLTFPVPASHASLQGLQALATAIAATWPIAAYQPRQQQQGGYQGGGNGYQNGGGFQNNNGFQGRRFGGGGGYGNGGGFRRW